MSDSRQLKRISQWADELGINRKQLQRAIGWGHLAATKLGIGDTSPYYCTDADISAWLESRKVRVRSW